MDSTLPSFSTAFTDPAEWGPAFCVMVRLPSIQARIEDFAGFVLNGADFIEVSVSPL